MSKRAEQIDAAHKLYRESIGTPNEEPAYELLVAVVRHATDSHDDPDAVMARTSGAAYGAR